MKTKNSAKIHLTDSKLLMRGITVKRMSNKTVSVNGFC